VVVGGAAEVRRAIAVDRRRGAGDEEVKSVAGAQPEEEAISAAAAAMAAAVAMAVRADSVPVVLLWLH
jgi:hypothetical protein